MLRQRKFLLEIWREVTGWDTIGYLLEWASLHLGVRKVVGDDQGAFGKVTKDKLKFDSGTWPHRINTTFPGPL